MSYAGISFPFRLNTQGGVKLSETTPYDQGHIEEGIYQSISIHRFERIMNPEIGSRLTSHILDPQDESLYNIIKYEVIKALKEQDNRIVVDESATTVYGEDSCIYVEIHYSISIYNKVYVTNIKLI